ncbi:reprolysin-like metallopeptidase [Galbibacter mesophilus]|uniref:reprolysin-like metallopeptidase n=1 Tax=Galbibacter mesophilus TaxID=379069 RepID=UPI00191D8253|nr:zinc-dependent metalloprotease family protein [Galbibacter mesophilus]MCM5661790.1 M12 family metallo-peptidase [Galbibacter mesophilus]
MNNTAKLFSIFCVLLYSLSTYSQKESVWQPAQGSQKISTLKKVQQTPSFHLNFSELKAALKAVSDKKNGFANKNNTVNLRFPTGKGTYETFKITEKAVLSKELSQKYPSIKSYQGVSEDNPLKRIYFSIDSNNFHGLIRNNGHVTLINPFATEKDMYYLADKSDFHTADFHCKVMEEKNAVTAKTMGIYSAKPVDDGQLRTYRMALACTGEYAEFHIEAANVTNGTTAQKKEAVLAAMNTTITRVNSVYENDLAIRLELIANNDDLIFLDPDTDGFTNGRAVELIEENQNIIDNIVGSSNYDIGHIFATSGSGGDGIAVLSSVCVADRKAKGATAFVSPVGDAYDIDFVAHEIGHQFGATHTFNNSCNSNRTLATAVEPGSGSTIMAYAGICPSNVQGSSDAYFHAISISQIWDNITQGASTCGSLENIPNSAPVISTLTNYSIPAGTAFVLDAEVTDSNGDVLTYSWEQQNNEVSVQPPVPDATGGPAFRSFLPTLSSKRYFPQESEILNNNLTPLWEVIPNVARTLNFSLLVRDNNPNGGQIARGDLRVATINTGEAFSITSQNSPETLQGGSVYTVNWNVAGTNKVPINTSFVDIYLIVENNFEAPILLSDNTKNDGTKQVVIPGDITTTNARIMVKAANNIFFAINEAVLGIQPSNFALLFNTIEYNVCQPNNIEIPFTYHAYNSFNETVSFTTEDAPSGLNINFSQPNATSNNTSINTSVSGIENLIPGNNSFKIVATASGGERKEYPIELKVFSNSFANVNLTSPANNETEVSLSPILSWEDYDNANQYEIQIAQTPSFSNILFSEILNISEYQAPQLEETQTYYWRVKPINTCGEGSFSPAFTFSTVNISCNSFENNNRVPIPSVGANTITSSIDIFENGFLNTMEVSVNISHTWLEDLSISLISPSGTVIPLIVNQCSEQNDMDVIFSDDGTLPICTNGTPALSGIVKPEETLATLNGEPIKGKWVLKVDDANDEDGGFINSFGIDFCVDGDFVLDSDQDGVLDPNDNCPNTPSGTKVDVNGCELFSLSPTNFNIVVTDESCIGNNDGSITVAAEESFSYTAILTGTNNASNSFSTSTTFEGLEAGTYNLCFTLEEEPNYQSCYEITVSEPLPLNVFTSKSDNNMLTLNLSGSNLYTIEHNGIISKTDKDEFEITLQKGINTLKVSGEKDCQGIFQELIISHGEISVIPNPVISQTTIYSSASQSETNLSLYDISGQLVFSEKRMSNSNGEIELNLDKFPSGLYLLNVENSETTKTIKIIKK